MIDPTGQKILQLYPQTNVGRRCGLQLFQLPGAGRLTKGEFDIRLDHNFSSKDSVFARFSYDQAISFVPGGGPPGFAEAKALSPARRTFRTTVATS